MAQRGLDMWTATYVGTRAAYLYMHERFHSQRPLKARTNLRYTYRQGKYSAYSWSHCLVSFPAICWLEIVHLHLYGGPPNSRNARKLTATPQTHGIPHSQAPRAILETFYSTWQYEPQRLPIFEPSLEDATIHALDQYTFLAPKQRTLASTSTEISYEALLTCWLAYTRGKPGLAGGLVKEAPSLSVFEEDQEPSTSSIEHKVLLSPTPQPRGSSLLPDTPCSCGLTPHLVAATSEKDGTSRMLLDSQLGLTSFGDDCEPSQDDNWAYLPTDLACAGNDTDPASLASSKRVGIGIGIGRGRESDFASNITRYLPTYLPTCRTSFPLSACSSAAKTSLAIGPRRFQTLSYVAFPSYTGPRLLAPCIVSYRIVSYRIVRCGKYVSRHAATRRPGPRKRKRRCDVHRSMLADGVHVTAALVPHRTHACTVRAHGVAWLLAGSLATLFCSAQLGTHIIAREYKAPHLLIQMLDSIRLAARQHGPRALPLPPSKTIPHPSDVHKSR
ncbi:hypothetical protein PMIN01_02965 [Paraphaeosphaeria minitans]|uniref:Uncharacterized protein n=1 Tax=Paraphaeosphaeria minitans TaxID=565426 RepID=A0A9P6GTN3_9PLEO|nr:hypothetical protein PMIN01_02965 [Paraphaeosphaeria minitans]